MNKLSIESIKQDKVTIDTQDIADGVKIIVSGDIDMQDPSTLLDPLFDKVHNGVLSSGLKTVELDVTNLTFIQSGLENLINIGKVVLLDSNNKYYSINCSLLNDTNYSLNPYKK